jgi:hypothetical protein
MNEIQLYMRQTSLILLQLDGLKQTVFYEWKQTFIYHKGCYFL